MKKTLIAVAASGIALAQSSVTLYGNANIGLQKTTGSKTKLAGGAGGAPSRFGFRGGEDLGGGLKANFTMEAGLDLATGATDSATFQRQAFVGLSGGFGEIRLGSQYTIGHATLVSYVPSSYTGAQLNSDLGWNSAGACDSGQIRYISPSFGGVKVELSTQLKANANNDAALTELAVTYGNGPIKAAVFASKVKDGDGTMGPSMGATTLVPSWWRPAHQGGRRQSSCG